MDIQFYVEERLYSESFFFYGRVRQDGERYRHIQPIALGEPFHKHEAALKPGDPFLQIGREEAQALFNQLWKIGFRPKDGTGNGGHIDALKYHLEDMRKLVFVNKEGH